MLAAEGVRAAVVIAGGAALNLLGIVKRVTRDVDVLALGRLGEVGVPTGLDPPEPLPEPLARAIRKVARDLRLPQDWMNAKMGGQWETGLPPGLSARVRWREYGGLAVGVVDRYDLIFFKLYAAADDVGPASVHYKDLLALRPDEAELRAAEKWVRDQDPSPGFGASLEAVVARLRADVG